MSEDWDMAETKFFWLIEMFELRYPWNSTGLYVAGTTGVAGDIDTTGWAGHAMKFRWRWAARLWNWVYNQSYRPGYHWKVMQHGFFIL